MKTAKSRTSSRKETWRESEERFRSLLAVSGQIICITSSSGRVTKDSPSWRAFTGQTYKQLKGLGWLSAVHPEDRRKTAKLWSKPSPNQNLRQMEFRLRHADGSYRHIVLRSAPIGREWIGTATDVTDYKQTKENLQKAITETRSILEHIADGFVAFDKEWRIVYVNRTGEKILSGLQKNPGEFIGKNFWEEFPDLIGTEVEKQFRRAATENELVTFEFFNLPLNNWFETRAYPSPDGVSVYYHDVTERKRSDEILRESERRFRVMADSAPVMIWSSGVDKLCNYFNKSWLEFTGRTMEQELGNGWAEGVHPDDLQRCLSIYVSSFDARREFKMEYRLRRYDGEFRWILDHGIPRFAPRGTFLGYIGSCIDIAERKQAEESLHRSEQRFRQLADAMPQIVWSARPDGFLDYYNKRWHEFTGLPEGKTGDESWRPILHPDDAQKCIEAWHSAVKSGLAYQVEYRFKDRKTGRYRWYLGRALPVRDEAGKIVRWFGTFTDIEDQKRAEMSFRFLSEASTILASSIDYKTTLQNVARIAVNSIADFCFFDLLTEDKRIQRVAWAHNVPDKQKLLDEFEHLTPPAGSKNHPVSKTIDSGKSTFVPFVDEAWIKNAAINSQHYQFIRNLDLSSLITVPVTTRGRLFGALTLCLAASSSRRFDIGDLALAEELGRRAALAVDNAQLYQQTLRARDQLKNYTVELEKKVAERTSKLQETVAELEAFSYSISHDLRAPLRAMQGFAHALAEDFADKVGSEGKEYLDKIIAASIRQDKLIHDVLDYSRVVRTEIKSEFVNLERIIRSTIQDNPAFQPPRAEIQIVGSIPQVIGHEASLTQVVSNLIGNAVKFVPKGTVPQVEIRADASNGHVRIWIKDNGIGIAPEHHQRIFGIFERLHNERAYEGTGIGLSIVKKAIQRMGGQVGIESELGKGCRFWFELPVAKV